MGWRDCGTRIIEVEWNAFEFMGRLGRLIGRLIDGRRLFFALTYVAMLFLADQY